MPIHFYGFPIYLSIKQKPGSFSAALPCCCTSHQFCGGVEAVEEVGGGNHEEQGGETFLVIMAGGLVPDVVGDGVGAVGKAGDGLGEGEGGTFGVGEVGCFAPGGDGEETLVGFTGLFGGT